MFGRFKQRNNIGSKKFNGRVNLLEKNNEELDPYLQKFMNCGSNQPEYMRGRKFKKAPLHNDMILARTKDEWHKKPFKPGYGEDLKYYTRSRPKVRSRISEHLLY